MYSVCCESIYIKRGSVYNGNIGCMKFFVQANMVTHSSSQINICYHIEIPGSILVLVVAAMVIVMQNMPKIEYIWNAELRRHSPYSFKVCKAGKVFALPCSCCRYASLDSFPLCKSRKGIFSLYLALNTSMVIFVVAICVVKTICTVLLDL